MATLCGGAAHHDPEIRVNPSRQFFYVAWVLFNFQKFISTIPVEHLSDLCPYKHPRVHGTSICHRLYTFHVSVLRILVTVAGGEFANIAMIAGGVQFLQWFYFCKKETPYAENIVCYSCTASGVTFDSARLKPILQRSLTLSKTSSMHATNFFTTCNIFPQPIFSTISNFFKNVLQLFH